MKSVSLGKAVFCLWCIEQLYPRLEAFSRKHQLEGSDALRTLIDACWVNVRQQNYAEIKKTAKSINKILDGLAPDTEDYPEPDAHVTLSCVTAIEYFLKYIASPKDDFVSVVNDSVLDAVDQKLSELFVDEIEETGDYSIVEEHPFFIAAKAKLSDQLALLSSTKEDDIDFDLLKQIDNPDLISLVETQKN